MLFQRGWAGLKKITDHVSEKLFTEVGNFFLRGGGEGGLQALHKHLYPLSD